MIQDKTLYTDLALFQPTFHIEHLSEDIGKTLQMFHVKHWPQSYGHFRESFHGEHWSAPGHQEKIWCLKSSINYDVSRGTSDWHKVRAVRVNWLYAITVSDTAQRLANQTGCWYSLSTSAICRQPNIILMFHVKHSAWCDWAQQNYLIANWWSQDRWAQQVRNMETHVQEQ